MVTQSFRGTALLIGLAVLRADTLGDAKLKLRCYYKKALAAQTILLTTFYKFGGAHNAATAFGNCRTNC